MGIETLVMAVVAALIYALAGFLDRQEAEGFDKMKMLATAVIGLVVGAVLWASGIPITSENVMLQMTAYAGLVAIVYKVLHAGIKWRTE